MKSNYSWVLVAIGLAAVIIFYCYYSATHATRNEEKTFIIEVTNLYGKKDTITTTGYEVELSFQRPGILETDNGTHSHVIAANVFTYKILETK